MSDKAQHDNSFKDEYNIAEDVETVMNDSDEEDQNEEQLEKLRP